MQYHSENSIKLVDALAALIKELRSKNYKSAHKFSCEYGIDSGHYSRLERAKAECKISTFYKIAQGLGLKPSELMRILEEKLGDRFSLIDE